jgi:ankyrin repeat protein
MFDGLPRPSIDFGDDEWQDALYDFNNNYSIMVYSCTYWSHHVHNANWDDVENDLLDIFCFEDTFKFWTLVWLYYEHKQLEDFSCSAYFEKHLSPTGLHWAAVFALDKLCARFIEDGMNVSQPSVMGTPLYCAILSRNTFYKYSEAKVLESTFEIDEGILWKRLARATVVRQLVETGASLDVPADPGGQYRALTIALEIEIYSDAPFIASTLLDAGARLSAEDFKVLHQSLDMILEIGDSCEDKSADSTLGGITPSNLIKAVSKDCGKCLMPGANFQFFFLVLNMISFAWPLEHLNSFFEIKFSEMCPESNGPELDRILGDESKDPENRLIIVLSKAVRNSSPAPEEAISALQKCFDDAVLLNQASIVSLLFRFNEGLDASHQCYWDKKGTTLLHYVLEHVYKKGAYALTAQSLIIHGADVVYPNKKGVTPIEMAAKKWDLNTFKLLWDSAVRSMALEPSPEIVEKILCCAISSSNRPVMEFLVEELFESKIMAKNSLLEFSVRQKTSTFLKLVIDRNYLSHLQSVHGRVFEEKDGDEQSEDQFLASRTDIERPGRTACQLQALYLAAKTYGSPASFKFLIERGVQPSHQYQDGNTILHILTPNRNENSFVKLQSLLKSHPKLNFDVPNNACLTPLALAVKSKNLRGMKLLLNAGASPDITLADNQTVLHIACYLGNRRAVESLVGRGCQTGRKNTQGLTPKDVAVSCGWYNIAVTIQNAINSAVSANGNHQITGNAVSTFAQTEDHGDLPLRVVQEESPPDGDARSDSSTMDIDVFGTSPVHNTTSIASVFESYVPEAIASISHKRQNSDMDASHLQASTKRNRPS